jgi:hypothetical protein
MKKQNLFGIAALAVMAILFAACPTGSGDGTGGSGTGTSTTPNHFTITGITMAMKAAASSGFSVAICRPGTTPTQILSDWAKAGGSTPPDYVVAYAQVPLSAITGGTISNGTLESASDGKDWRGSGSYTAFIGLMSGSSGTMYQLKSPRTLTAGGSITVNLTSDFNALGTYDGNGTHTPAPNPPSPGSYTVLYTAVTDDYTTLTGNMPITPAASDTDWLLLTGTATGMYDEFLNQIGNLGYVAGGEQTAANFSTLISAAPVAGYDMPNGLKTALTNNEANAPLAGMYQAGTGPSTLTIMFYINKN